MNQPRPDPEELKSALAASEQMRAEGNDPRHIARSMRYLYSRCRGLEDLLQTTDRFLRFGMPEHELSEMRRLVDRLRESGAAADDSHEVDRTLPL
ncbi:MAG: hypothetical protein WBM71_02360 [Sedimenticolaceae bacterium]|jgi:hypothetical protein